MSLFEVVVGSPTERRLLPSGGRRSATTYIIAIMAFAMMLSAAAGLALANAATLVADVAANRFLVQVPDSSPQRIEAVQKALAAIGGVHEIEAVPREEMRQTLERWLGPAADAADLPLPGIVYFDASAAAAERAAERLPQEVAGASVLSESESLGPLLRPLRALQWTALALVLLMAAAASAAVVLATRGALETHRSTIEIMHGIGATDEQIARLFQRKIALDAGIGAVAGALLAAIALIAIAGGGASIAGATGGRPALGGWDLLAIALVPLAATLLSTLVARMAVLGALRNS